MFTPVGHPAAVLAARIAAHHQLQRSEELREAANKIIAKQNLVLAQAHAALLLVFEKMTFGTATWHDVGTLKKIDEAIRAIEGRAGGL